MCIFVASLHWSGCWCRSGWVGIHICKKRLSALCSLAAENLANSRTLPRSKATVDVYRVCKYCWHCVQVVRVSIYIHPAWASALLLVFGKLGNARAFSSGTGNRDKTPALFYVCYQTIIRLPNLGSSIGVVFYVMLYAIQRRSASGDDTQD